MNILIDILLVTYVLVALLMTLVILMQRPKSEGLGAAFGSGVTENIFGAQTTNVLVKFTAWLAGIFFLLTFALSILYAHRSMSQSALRTELLKAQTGASPSPATSVSPAAGTVSPAPSTTGSPSQTDSPVGSVQPQPSSAVDPPGTVTNPTPAGSAPSVRPADAAVGAVPAATAQPTNNRPQPAKSAAPSASPRQR